MKNCPLHLGRIEPKCDLCRSTKRLQKIASRHGLTISQLIEKLKHKKGGDATLTKAL